MNSLYQRTYDISVIIPSFNRCESLLKTLQALQAQTVYSIGSFEVIIVDDGSTDGSREAFSNLPFPYPYRLVKQENKGPGAARNYGADLAKGHLLVFLDADMIPSSNLLQDYLIAYRTSPQKVFVGRQLPWDEAFISKFDQHFNYVNERDPGPDAVKTPFYYFASGNVAICHTIFSQLQGFDEQLKMTEDTDFAFRAFKAGVSFQYLPHAVGYHNHPKTLQELCKNWYSSAWWTAQLTLKHPDLKNMIPAYSEVNPISLGKDNINLVLRKLLRQLFATKIGLSCLWIGVYFLEKIDAPSVSLKWVYWKLLYGYRIEGYKNGLRNPMSTFRAER